MIKIYRPYVEVAGSDGEYDIKRGRYYLHREDALAGLELLKIDQEEFGFVVFHKGSGIEEIEVNESFR